MNETLIRNWNEVVAPDDTVWHLGDFAFCQLRQFEELLRRLNGHKNVVLGNHDKVIINHRKHLLQSGLFESIERDVELRLDDAPMIVLHHYGKRVWNKSHYGSIHLYGHSHGSLPPYGKSVDVGVDCREVGPGYRPYSLTEVLQYMSGREFKKADHHG